MATSQSISGNSCSPLVGSLEWCEGKTVLPGIRRRLYYTSKSNVVKWPELARTAQGQVISGKYPYNEEIPDGETEAVPTNDFELKEGVYWNAIDILTDKSGLTSEAQGEYPSQTQLNKLVAVYPGTDETANMAAAYINNNDCVYIIEGMDGKLRVLGNNLWHGKATVAQDLGQGPTGTASTTINVEHTDLIPAPIYDGWLVIGTEAGDSTTETVEVKIRGVVEISPIRDDGE